jgi:hypothetical protein
LRGAAERQGVRRTRRLVCGRCLHDFLRTTGTNDFRPLSGSPLINAGTTVAGRTTDFLGNPIVGAPDIGAYEF